MGIDYNPAPLLAWSSLALGFLFALYFVIRIAVLNALRAHDVERQQRRADHPPADRE